MADEDLSNTEQSSSIPSGDALVSQDVPASSSDADQGESKESLLEAVQKAVPELRQDADDPSIDPGASPAQAAKDASVDESELPDAVTQEELAKYSKAAQKRISKLNKQRQKLTGEVQRLKEIEPSAQAAEQVTGYLRNNDISREDFLMGLELMSAMRRGDFRTFYEGVKPYMRLAEEYLGHALPPDLQSRVNQGEMTTQAAQMYSRERMDRAMAQTNVQREQQRLASYQQATQQTHQQQQQQYLANSVRDTVNHWEAAIMRTDPDYAAKKPAVQDTMWAVVKEQGPPTSPDHAIAIAKEAYRRVNERYRQWAPQRRPTFRSPSSTGRTAGVSPEPKSLQEAVQFAREGASRL